jgi:hypothetical protein
VVSFQLIPGKFHAFNSLLFSIHCTVLIIRDAGAFYQQSLFIKNKNCIFQIITTEDEKACKEWEYFLGGKSGRTEFCPS